MNTILIDVEEAAKDLHTVAHRLRSSGTRALLMYGDRVLAELSPFPRPDGESDDESEASHGSRARVSTPEGWQRIVRSPVTGRSVVAARPGERKITSEEIYELLRNS